jgi:predicted nucleic acid-binding protein
VKPTLLDSGVIVGLLDRSETYHNRCVSALEELEGPLVTCEAVIAESCYLLRRLPGAAEAVLDNVEGGIFPDSVSAFALNRCGASSPEEVSGFTAGLRRCMPGSAR